MAEVVNYTPAEKFVHTLAFAFPRLQVAVADAEDVLFGRSLGNARPEAPIFITSLPRAGTTILLRALGDVPETATHVYRDMPFIMAPLMWARLSAGFRKPTILRERAHGDGLDIGYDSPEAFEEVIWHTFWPDHYGADGIRLWSKDDVSDEARVFMERHFHKIVALRGRDRPATRYLSKNNGNIARLGLILAMFPDAHVVVPVRHPAAHAGSLHRQHLNFLAQHAADTFTARYMRDIGHFEFGALHRPILFDGFAERADGMSPAELDYWLTYWISAFSHLSRFKDRVHVVGYEALCNGGEAAAARLCSAVGLPPAHSGRLARHFRAVEPAEWPEGRHAPALRDEAAALYETFIS